MKKKLAAVCALLACVFAFAACSSRVTVSLGRNWQTNTSGGYDSSFYEQLTYDVRYERDGESLNNLYYANVSGTYTVTTQADSYYRAADDLTVNQAYRIDSVLTVSASIVDQNGDVVYAFGGDSGVPADTILSTVWFRDTSEEALPLESSTQVYSHTPLQSGNIAIYSYTTSIVYNTDAAGATVTMTDTSDTVTENADGANERVVVGSFESSTRNFSKLTEDYSVFDNEQLMFAGRGLTFAADTSHTVNVVSAAAGGAAVTLSCSEVADRPYSFNFNGQALSEQTIATCVVNFSRSGAGDNTGTTHTVDYANRSSNASANTYRNLPLRITTNLSYAMGSFLYVLTSANYTEPTA